jgi:DNA-binding MarR family transcriptional regulator
MWWDATTMSDPEKRALGQAESFAESWEHFVLSLRRAQARGAGAAGQLTLAQYYLLSAVESSRETPLGKLARASGIAAPTATRLVDGLERAGLLRRIPAPEDRRAVAISLTEEGGRRLAVKREELSRRRRRLYDALEPEDRERAERLLRHLAQLIEDL